MTRGPIPEAYQKQAAEQRQTLLERLADADDFIAEKVPKNSFSLFSYISRSWTELNLQ
jgi:aspartate/methionine/tyrosine aminotransferase